MKRHAVLIIALFYVFGTIGIPVVAYCCIEIGEAGVRAYFPTSPGSCYADACCEDDPNPQSVRIESGIPCCNVAVPVTPENNRILLPTQKHGQVSPLTDTPGCFDASRCDIRIASAPALVVTFHASINLPLLI